MKKKDKSNLEHIIIMGLIMTLIILFFIIVFGNFDKFNPETDVCLDEGFESCYKQTLNKECYLWKCKDWRPKTKCELNPNDEDCVCEEWKETCPDYKCTCKMIRNKSLCDDIMELCFKQAMKLPKEKICIKAHLKNECEKGNEDWVWDIISVKAGEVYGVNTTFLKYTCGGSGMLDSGTGTCNKKLCRKKTSKEKCEEVGGTLNLIKGLNLVKEIDDEVCIIPK